MINEFAIIKKYFVRDSGKRDDVILGIGDDCALLQIPQEKILAVSIDTLVEDVHFFKNTPAYFLGYKSLAVSLSDMAAMGAEPAWVTAATVLPDDIDEQWLSEFCRGFTELLQKYSLQLVGGNMAHGPLSITTQLHGFIDIERKNALRRSNAQVGDTIYVTGNLGDAGLALELLRNYESGCNTCDSDAQKTKGMETVELEFLRQRLYCPIPRVKEGLALREIAHAAIDISDGLSADLKHILEASNVGATIYVDQLPISSWLRQNREQEYAWQLALSAGDDYELCFTAPAKMGEALAMIAKQCKCKITPIGLIELQPGLRLHYTDGKDFICKNNGYMHLW